MLILLNGDKLQLVTGAQDVNIHASYVDKAADGSITAGRANLAFTSAGTHDVLAGPASGVERNVDFVSVHNAEASDPATFSIVHNDATVQVRLRRATLAAGDVDNWSPIDHGDKGDTGATGAAGAAGDPSPAGWDTVFVDSKATGTDGGTFTSAAWRVRTLNTELQDRLGISLSSNQFSLLVGTYEIEWSCPAYYVGRHQSRLFNVTNNVIAGCGTPEYSPGAPLTDSCQTRSVGYAVVTIGGIPGSYHTFQLEHACYSTENSNGFGLNANFSGSGMSEIYSIVKIRKIA